MDFESEIRGKGFTAIASTNNRIAKYRLSVCDRNQSLFGIFEHLRYEIELDKVTGEYTMYCTLQIGTIGHDTSLAQEIAANVQMSNMSNNCLIEEQMRVTAQGIQTFIVDALIAERNRRQKPNG